MKTVTISLTVLVDDEVDSDDVVESVQAGMTRCGDDIEVVDVTVVSEHTVE